jgi:putative tricarboxylic transport membrane protein
MFGVILAGGFIGCFMILLLGLTVGPLLAKIAIVPQKHLLPIVAILCVIGAYAASTNSFDILIMIIFGFIGFVMRKRGFPVAPMVLGLVLGGIMDSNFRRAISLASSSPNPIADLFLNPISIVLVLAIVFSIVSKFIPFQQIFGKILRKKKEA